MDLLLKEKYSIKKKLQDHLQSVKQNVSLTEIKPSQLHIYTPEHEGYFLRAIEKQIKYEGNILKRIKKKINQFKDAKLKKKYVKNSASHYMQSMFSPSSIKYNNGERVKTIEQAATHSSSLLHSPQRRIYSSNTTKRDNSKIKFVSFTACKSRQLFEQTQANYQKNNNLHLKKQTDYEQRHNFEGFGVKRQRKSAQEKIVIKSSPNTIAFSLSGTKPQWSSFECYRSWNCKKKIITGK